MKTYLFLVLLSN